MAMHYLEEELFDSVFGTADIFRFLQQAVLDGIWYWDVTQPENEWYSPEFCRLLGYDPKEVPHNSGWWQDRIFEEDKITALHNFKLHLSDPSHPYDQVVRYRHKDGSTVWVRCRGLALRDETGKPIRLLGSHIDLTELHKTQEKLERLTFTDPTTELLNRRGLEDVLSRWLSRASREIQKVYAAVLDLDDFKQVNDRYGHARGDALLQAIADRIKGTMRPYDAAARIGGDEFCVTYLCEHREQATKALERLQEELRKPFQVGSIKYQASFSAALIRVHEPSTKGILAGSRMGLKRSKMNGKDQYTQIPTLMPSPRLTPMPFPKANNNEQ